MITKHCLIIVISDWSLEHNNQILSDNCYFQLIPSTWWPDIVLYWLILIAYFGNCYIICRFSVYYILVLRFCCVVVLQLYLMCFLQLKFVTWIWFFSFDWSISNSYCSWCCIYLKSRYSQHCNTNHKFICKA